METFVKGEGVRDRYRAMKLAILFLAGVFALVVGPSSVSAQSKPAMVCADAKGKLSVRPKCRSGETKLSLSVLASKAATGPTGPTGATGASGYQLVSTLLDNQTVSAGGSTFSVACPAGKTTLGGGCYTGSNFVVQYQSYPSGSNPAVWNCGFAYTNGIDSITIDLFIYAICVDQ